MTVEEAYQQWIQTRGGGYPTSAEKAAFLVGFHYGKQQGGEDFMELLGRLQMLVLDYKEPQKQDH